MELEQLEPAHRGEALAGLPEEVGVRRAGQHARALAPLPAPRLELEEALHRVRVAGAVRAFQRGAEQLLELAALAHQLAAPARGEPVEQPAPVGPPQRGAVEGHLARAHEVAAVERVLEGRGDGAVR